MESQLIFDDQLAELKSTSKKVGTQGDDIDIDDFYMPEGILSKIKDYIKKNGN